MTTENKININCSQIMLKNPNDLRAHPKNSREHTKEQLGMISKSIKRVGFNSPIVVDEDLVILKGHGTCAASKMLNMKEVPVVVLKNLSDQQKREYLATDNMASELGSWNESMLTSEINQLQKLTGFADVFAEEMQKNWSEVIEQMDGWEKKKEQSTKDQNTKADKKPIEFNAREYETWQLGNSTAFCGEFGKNYYGPIDLVLTDPPYGINYLGGSKTVTKYNIKKDKGINDALDVWKAFMQKLDTATKHKTDNLLCITFTGKNASFFQFACENHGHIFLEHLVWSKNIHATMTRTIRPKHELAIATLIKNNPKSKYYKINKPFNTVINQFDDENYPAYYDPDTGELMVTMINGEEIAVTGDNLKAETRFTTLMLENRSLSNTYHPTQKPVALIQRIIANFTHPGDTVLDPFAGSMTAAIAAEKSGRKAYCCEIDPKLFSKGLERFYDETGIKPERIG